jgi:hypothetical protein
MWTRKECLGSSQKAFHEAQTHMQTVAGQAPCLWCPALPRTFQATRYFVGILVTTRDNKENM